MGDLNIHRTRKRGNATALRPHEPLALTTQVTTEERLERPEPCKADRRINRTEPEITVIRN